jgi:hypothetical protein
MSFPNPTWTEVVISFKLFMVLYIPKRALDYLLAPLFNHEVKALKRAIYKHHQQHHSSILRNCTEDLCKLKKLQSLPRSQGHLSSVEVAAVLPELEG